ncbi:MAG: hypothetical protein IKT40_11900 [Bacilli bacterium]|nr:hypothetical protein [Bacilli bacterium]
MSKKVISISEDKLKQILYEAVEKILKENGQDELFDVSTIDIETLKSIYIDLRLIPTSCSYGDVLSDLPFINEAYNDIMPLDEAIKTMKNRYGLPDKTIFKVEKYNKVCIYIVNALIGVNDKLIENDMHKLGYFLGYRGRIQEVCGMRFQVLQFEPYSHIQDDNTEEIKSKYKYLFHWTPSYNIRSILETGLTPNHQNDKFSYPNRIYLMKGDVTDENMYKFGHLLCVHNKNEKNNGEYGLLKIDISTLDDNIRFRYDSNSEIGIYTEQGIDKIILN